jgi:hypothetical protein
MNDSLTFSFSSTNGGAGPTNPTKPSSNVMIAERLLEFATIDEDESVTVTGHVRYLHDFGSLVAGVEAGHAGVGYIEGQIGFDLGRVLAYTALGVNEDGNQYAVGLDVAVGAQRDWLIGARYVSQDDGFGGTYERPEIRVSYRF